MFCLHGVSMTEPCSACAAEGEGNTRQPGPPYDIPGVLVNQNSAQLYKMLRDAHAGFPSPLWMYALLTVAVSIGKSLDCVREEFINAFEALWKDVRKPGSGGEKPPEVVH